MTPQEVLLAAADWIENHGWRQYGYPIENGRRLGGNAIEPGPKNKCNCVGLTIQDLTNFSSERAALVCLAEFLGLKTENPYSAIYEWNDTPGRTKAEVLAALRGAAGRMPGEGRTQP